MVAALTFHSADDKFARLGLGKKKFWRGRTPNANRGGRFARPKLGKVGKTVFLNRQTGQNWQL